MKQCFLLLGIVTLLMLTSHSAQAQADFEQVWAEGGSVKIAHTNTGVTGFDVRNSRDGLQWGLAPNQGFLFASGVWLGGQIRVEGQPKKRTFITYDPSSGRSWSNPTSAITKESFGDISIYTSTFDDIDLSKYTRGAAVALADSMPLGLSFRQTLTINPLESVADLIIVRTVARNVHPWRTIELAAMGNVVDPDIVSPIEGTARGDDFAVKVGDEQMQVVKIYSGNDPLGPCMYSILDPREAKLTTMRGMSIATEPFEHEDRYNFMTSGIINPSIGPADVRFVLTGRPRDLAPGDSIAQTIIFLLSRTGTAQRDAEVVDLFKRYTGTTSVNEDQPAAPMMFPNPTNGASFVELVGATDFTSVELIDLTGSVLSRMPSTRQLPVSALAPGVYSVRM
ncbi:MAG: T9SS type A sorting domain-containing protein, partial [Candidatus Kapabacteria bacterium]|nr:T9SS type A sorting domain-containing protein [Candidatus Kapabacteria bacterium]